MPLISRTFIKAGMVFFALSLIAALIIEIDVSAFPPIVPLFWHMLMLGWITQIIFGVSIWMFPGRTREEGFYPQLWGWLTFLFLNSGLALRIISEPFAGTGAWQGWSLLLVASAILQLMAGITYVIEMWPRILSKKGQLQRCKRQRKKRES